MPANDSSGNLDIPFSVPFTHRLRFTDDLLAADQQVLLDLLERSGSGPARVQFWLDHDVSAANPHLVESLKAFCNAHPDQVERVGPIQHVAGGEAIKNDIHILERMLKIFNVSDLDRRSYVIVIGGGAVLDAVGFAAAIAHRGIRLIRLPTTVLAQDDSGVGVKNGVNLFGKKNWLGSFAVPWAVVNDAALLSTLGDRDFVCGFSEAVKVALLKDADLFDRLCRDATRIAERDMSAAAPVIRASAQWHLRHITRGGDPFEMLEARPLDYGHWSAHKLEAMTDFQLRHGEAVAIGVAVDTLYSAAMFGLPQHEADRVLRCLTDMGMPLYHEALEDTETLFGGLEEFRQHLGGRLTLTMLNGVGDPFEVHEVDRVAMCRAIEQVAEYARQSQVVE